MTQTDIASWELTVPDEIIPCWVYASHPPICPDGLASWIVQVPPLTQEFFLCNACKTRWESYGTVLVARPIRQEPT